MSLSRTNFSQKRQSLQCLRYQNAMLRTSSSGANCKGANASLSSSIVSLNPSMRSFDSSHRLSGYTPITKEASRSWADEDVISFLCSEIDKIKANAEEKGYEIERLNKGISVLEVDINELQGLGKEGGCKQKVNYKKMYEDANEAFNKERLGYEKRILQLQRQCEHQRIQYKCDKEAMAKALNAVLLDAQSIKRNCIKMKEEWQYISQLNRELTSRITTSINQRVNKLQLTPKVDLSFNEPAPIKELSQRSSSNSFIPCEPSPIFSQLSKAIEENKLLIQRIKSVNEENHSLRSIIQCFIAKNGVTTLNTKRLKEHYERILKEKSIQMKEVHSAINESINGIHNISSISKANALDREVKEIMRKNV